MIRRGRLRQLRKRAPATLKKRKGGNRAVGNSAPVSISNLRISTSELNFNDLGAISGIRVYRRFREKGNAEGVSTGPGDGEARNWTCEIMVERINRE